MRASIDEHKLFHCFLRKRQYSENCCKKLEFYKTRDDWSVMTFELKALKYFPKMFTTYSQIVNEGTEETFLYL